eukprot:366204-Chlamydomonas_euryale.AAC.8
MRSRGAIGCAACCAGRQKCGSGTRSCWPCTTTEMVTSGPPRAASISLRSSEPPGGSACCDERTSPEGDLMTPCWRTYSCQVGEVHVHACVSVAGRLEAERAAGLA